MLALLGALLGGAFRLAPEILKLFNAKSERAHELSLRKLDAEIADRQAANTLRELDLRSQMVLDSGALTALTEAVSAEKNRVTGVKWIDALSASVRPMVTYWWMSLYTVVKIAQVTSLSLAGSGVVDAILATWTEFDQVTLGGIINFWFLDRVLKKRS